MNSEELELSLRTEFESYLKGVVAGMRQDVTEFHQKFEAEFVKHKAQMDEAIRDLSTRFESENTFDKAFTESVVEHLRLARDDGARITANAFGEAEKLKEESAPAANYDVLRDAINDITSKTTQSAILKALVDHAGQFTPRGAFFIVKNEHFVGWKVFGSEAKAEDAAVRDIHFPISADTILAKAVNTVTTCDGKYGDRDGDAVFLDKLEFGRPDRMYAIPLTARGRGVAVLYADYGIEGVALNIEALESLVRVAGLTVELLAASQTPRPAAAVEGSAHYAAPAVAASVAVQPAQNGFAVPVSEQSFEEYQGEVEVEETESSFDSEADADAAFSAHASDDEQFDDTAYFEPVADDESDSGVSGPDPEQSSSAFAFTPSEPTVDASRVEPEPAYAYSGDAVATNGRSVDTISSPAAEASAPPAGRSSFRDRNVDLPIEVSDDERRWHNDARRFARLLVSEIKLYNEQKVTEGRDSSDLYDRLRDAVDRSREMYDKRVKPEVATKFDYFHYELVGGLAEGDASKLGASYPGATV